ncbi:hypothetical protein [Halorhodospira halophila]|uniref:hypothetical protein n=1 Tax=Halorhodospira halophila TaxID=1053 RepID=UPI001912E434|nr:hypothetical protein [Halorhodospira halophila]MBK5942566.1 hypothetical protein [Halorhodospira halophila]
MNNKTKSLVLSGAAVALATPMSSALALDDVLGFGAWMNYSYNDEEDETAGNIDFESFNIYANHEHDDWFFDAEVRFGSGSFQNFSGQTVADDGDDSLAWGIKELAIGRHYGDDWTMTVGKTSIPFAWSRYNFWPGARQASGFDDSDGTGIRFDWDPGTELDGSLMFVKNQNMGDDPTQQDDGTFGFWEGDNDYFRGNTLIGDVGFTALETRWGFSAQAGELISTGDASESESFYALSPYFEGTYGGIDVSGKIVHYDLEDEVEGTPTPDEGQVLALSAGVPQGDWYHYTDLSMQLPDDDSSLRLDDSADADNTMDAVLGTRYNYGPGWIYLEALVTNVTEEDNPTGTGVYEDDTNFVIDITMDYYF